MSGGAAPVISLSAGAISGGHYYDLSGGSTRGRGQPDCGALRPRLKGLVTLPRSAAQRLVRPALALCLASFGVCLGASQADALDQGGDTMRLLSFGGMCVNCELSGRKLPDARFLGANFMGATFVGSDMRGASFFGSNFANADLTRADLRGANLFGSDFMNANFTDANVAGVTGHGVNLVGANLTRANFQGANMTGGELMRVNARQCRFDGANLFGVNLTQGRFDGASFRDAQLVGAILTGGVFTGADFRGAVLMHASLAGADLSGAKGLTQEQVGQACSAAGTRLPTGLVPKTCSGLPNFIIMHSTPSRAGAPQFVIEPLGPN